MGYDIFEIYFSFCLLFFVPLASGDGDFFSYVPLLKNAGHSLLGAFSGSKSFISSIAS